MVVGTYLPLDLFDDYDFKLDSLLTATTYKCKWRFFTIGP